MVDSIENRPPAKTSQQRRQERLAQALRENLKRRKAWREEVDKMKKIEETPSE